MVRIYPVIKGVRILRYSIENAHEKKTQRFTHERSSPSYSIKSLRQGHKLPVITEPITLELISDKNKFQDLESEWNNLYQKTIMDQTNSASYLWNWKVCKSMAKPCSELITIVGRKAGKVILVLPLMRYTTSTYSQVQFLSDHKANHSTLLIDNHADKLDWLARAYVFLRTKVEWDSLRLRDVQSQSLLLFFLKKQNAVCIPAAKDGYYECVISRNLMGHTLSGLIQSHFFADKTYRNIKSVFLSSFA